MPRLKFITTIPSLPHLFQGPAQWLYVVPYLFWVLRNLKCTQSTVNFLGVLPVYKYCKNLNEVINLNWPKLHSEIAWSLSIRKGNKPN